MAFGQVKIPRFIKHSFQFKHFVFGWIGRSLTVKQEETGEATALIFSNYGRYFNSINEINNRERQQNKQ